MSGSEHARPVWLTREQRDHLARYYPWREGGSPVGDIIAEWDAAPADPVRTAMSALRNERLLPVRSYDDRAVHVVLRALGSPSIEGVKHAS